MLISVVVFCFYLIYYTLINDLYKYPVMGALYEMLALPMLAMLLILPVISVLLFIKNSKRYRLHSTISLLLIISSVIVIIAKNL